VLKGALMLQLWSPEIARATKDIDFLSKGDNSPDKMAMAIKEICQIEYFKDGLIFDAESVAAERIKEGAEYEGIRISFLAHLGKAVINMQIDNGFGDSVTPAPKIAEYPSLLGFPSPKIRCYPRETVIAEKFEAMTKLGLYNSRMKDFYDIWHLSRQFDFEGNMLMKAVAETFTQRQTTIDINPIALTPEFTKDPTKRSQWRGFVSKTRLGAVPPDFDRVVNEISQFLLPLAKAANEKKAFNKLWQAGDDWK
jgi:hypothetical protein